MTSSETVQDKQIHWPSVFQFGLAGLASAGLLTIAGSMFFAGLLQFIDPSSAGPAAAATTMMVAAGMATGGLLALPVAAYGLARVLGSNLPLPNKLPSWWRWVILVSLVVFVFVVLIGFLVSSVEAVAWLALPPLHVLGMSLPVLWLVWIGTRKLIGGSAQRSWGVFGAGLVMGPFFILILELALMVLLFLMAFFVLIFVAAANPEIVTTLDRLAIQLQTLPSDSRRAQVLLGPYILRPELLLGSLFFIAVCVPLIEEALKPIGVWLLAGRKLTPRDGLALGMLSGAGYALFENLLQGAMPEAWPTLAIVRIGTSVMHIFTAGLTGWGLALAWRERSYLKLGLAYFLASLIHGLWNANAIIFSFTMLSLEIDGPLDLPIFWVAAAPATLIVLALGTLGGLLFANRRLREPEVEVEVEPAA
ncbi:MAG: PrsW family intramembrane metalloprotease [Chloroflexi bacterium]|nr:MAG: PrsW family intramembrane metalloprotease [Chloroflexota bacterium]MBL1194556.1 PrsW family intramembrane metalloprotease [Chloroflexota bacterium]NOH11844.1 PrsW family intramembrane metalloprotease [Chloroflexota bacterium]